MCEMRWEDCVVGVCLSAMLFVVANTSGLLFRLVESVSERRVNKKRTRRDANKKRERRLQVSEGRE